MDMDLGFMYALTDSVFNRLDQLEFYGIKLENIDIDEKNRLLIYFKIPKESTLDFNYMYRDKIDMRVRNNMIIAVKSIFAAFIGIAMGWDKYDDRIMSMAKFFCKEEGTWSNKDAARLVIFRAAQNIVYNCQNYEDDDDED